MPTEWRLKKVVGGVVEDQLIDVQVVDAFNRLARRAVAVLNDPDANKRAAYPLYTRVELEAKRDIDGGFTRRLGGFVIDHPSQRRQVQLEILSYDYWLKHRDVLKTYTAQTILAILEDLITTLTPLTWDASKVTVTNNRTVTREWRGERLDAVVAELASISADEEFGADDDGKFFFRARSTTSAPRQFSEGEYIEADFAEDAKHEVNKVTLYYGNPMKAVTVEDRDRQLQLQNLLGAPRAVVVEVTKTYPEISNEEAAERKAKKVLNESVAIQTGLVRTWEAFDFRPGHVVRVVDSDQAIDADFRVAELEYRWAEDVTLVKVAENREGVLDVLVAMSDEVRRLENRDADPSVAIAQFVDVEVPADVPVSVEVWRASFTEQLMFGGQYGAGLGGWGDPTMPVGSGKGGRWGDQRTWTQVV